MHDFMAWMQASALGYIGNPFLLVKCPAIGLGLINVLVLTRSPAWRARSIRELSVRT